MARKPSIMLWLCKLIILFLFITFSLEPVSCIETKPLSTESAISYSDYCSSIVPESKPNFLSRPYSFFGPLRRSESGYFYSSGGNRILNSNITRFWNSFSFQTRLVYKTDRDGVFKIESSLVFQTPFYYSSRRNHLSFKLRGFWSESSGNLCMVGQGSAYSNKGKLLTPAAVLKLTNLKNTSDITTLITGSLISVSSTTDENYFEPVSLLMIPQLKYNYTFASEEFVDGFSGGSDNVQGLAPYNIQPRRGFCSMISSIGTLFDLQYSSRCSPGRNCFPLDGKVGHLPSAMSLTRLEYCSDVKRKVRLLIEFHNTNHVGFYHLFNPNSTLIGEGFWDDKKNRLYVFVCRFLDMTESWSHARVGDCKIRLTLRFPGILSMRERSSMVGQIWTNETSNDSGYFYRIMFQSTEDRVEWVPGLMYEYTEMERVNKSCPRKKPARKKEQRYPSNSIDMKFDMSVKSSEGKTGWGFAVPLSVGDRIYKQNLNPAGAPPGSRILRTELRGLVNISYKIGITLRPALKVDGYNVTREKMKITAEGIYDVDTGSLCMVGCRNIESTNQLSQNASVDCEILLNFQFPPLKPNRNGGYIKGSIESTQKKSDPLYFNHLDLSSAAYGVEQAKRSLRTMDVEIIMVLVSNTLVCVFVGLQLYHAKKNPQVLSFISLIMLVILTLSYMIPLVLNFEALFSRKQDQNTILVHSAGWLEVNEVIVRIITMVTFLLQFRLLQLALSARSENHTGMWFAEKMTLLVALSIYMFGAFIAILVNWGKHKFNKQQRPHMLIPSDPAQNRHDSTWKDLKSYSGLISDGFLLPQILLNIFSNSKETTLSCSFYVGTTFIRLLPHVFDLYSNHSYIQHKGTYILVNPSEDFFSTTWDVCIPLGLLLFAAIIFLQQRFGGRCVLPSRFRYGELKAYENVPVNGES